MSHSPSDTILKYGSALLRRDNFGPWRALIPVESVEVDKPCHRWEGGKIPQRLVRQGLAFFEWSFDFTKSETILHGFYNETTREWAFEALPQKGYTGMTIRLLDAAADVAKSAERLGPDWELCLTWHHHCEASAFQSSVDEKDEKGTPGLHLTTGHVGCNYYSVHARASFKQLITPVYLSEWFDLPQEFSELPAGIKDKIVEHYLCTPAEFDFPAHWKENVIKEEPRSTVTTSWNFQGQSGCHTNTIPASYPQVTHSPITGNYADGTKDRGRAGATGRDGDRWIRLDDEEWDMMEDLQDLQLETGITVEELRWYIREIDRQYGYGTTTEEDKDSARNKKFDEEWEQWANGGS